MKNALELFYLCAAVASVLTAAIIRRRRAAPEAAVLTMLVLAAGAWAFGDAIELLANTVTLKRVVAQFQYFAIVAVAPLFLHTSLVLADVRRSLDRRVLLAVWLIPALTVLVAWTSMWHTWLWTSIEIPDPTTNLGVYHYGWWFWVFALHSYALLAVSAVVMIVGTRRVARAFRVSLSAVLVAVLLPGIGNVAYILKAGPLDGVDWFGISILLSGLILAWATTHRGLLDLLPRARETLVDSMQDGVLLSDEGDRVVYANDAALGLMPAFIEPGEQVPPELLEVATNGTQVGTSLSSRHAEVALLAGEHWLDVRSDPLKNRWNDVVGRIWTVRDITARKSLEAEKDTLLSELESALGTLRRLEGIHGKHLDPHTP
jgi:PAS domain-containing protein